MGKRKHGNNTNIVRMPTVNKDAVATEKQAEKRELFSNAALYAKGAIASADLKKSMREKQLLEKRHSILPSGIFAERLL